jgi:hypothetical protein
LNGKALAEGKHPPWFRLEVLPAKQMRGFALRRIMDFVIGKGVKQFGKTISPAAIRGNGNYPT